jgi:hypothetical protein
MSNEPLKSLAAVAVALAAAAAAAVVQGGGERRRWTVVEAAVGLAAQADYSFMHGTLVV